MVYVLVQTLRFFSTVKVETNPNLHHISYHSAIPYNNCVFYTANRVPQDARATYYALPGTPRASVNGQALTNLGSITEASVAQNAGSNAILSVKVTETGGMATTVGVKIKAFQNITANTNRVFVALVEKKVTYDAPNTEKTHYNVFRKFINANGELGEPLPAIANGAEATLSFSYGIESGWVGSQIYAIVWVQNPTTKEVLNSGTRFDVTSSVEDKPNVDAQVLVSPNPTLDKTFLTFDKLTPQYLTVSNVAGQVVRTEKLTNPNGFELNLSDFAKGIYFVKITANEGIAVKKIVKE